MNDKFFTRLGNQLNAARFAAGNLSDDVNLFGQVGMMFLPIPGLGNVDDMNSDALARVSDMASDNMSEESEERANEILQNARDFSSNEGGNSYYNINKAVSDFFEVAADHAYEPTGEERSEYAKDTGEVTERTTKPFEETDREVTERKEGQTTGTIDPIIEPESDVQAPKSGEGKPRDVDSLLGNGEETTTEDEDSEADEIERDYAEEFAEDMLMEVAEYGMKSLLAKDSGDGGKPRSRAQLTMSRKAQLGRDLPISQTPDIFPSQRTNTPRISDGMWGAGSDYQRSLKSKLGYGIG